MGDLVPSLEAKLSTCLAFGALIGSQIVNLSSIWCPHWKPDCQLVLHLVPSLEAKELTCWFGVIIGSQIVNMSCIWCLHWKNIELSWFFSKSSFGECVTINYIFIIEETKNKFHIHTLHYHENVLKVLIQWQINCVNLWLQNESGTWLR